MKKFQYQIVRYTADKVTGEFANVGIIVFQPDTGFLESRFINKYSRISNFFPEINGQYLVNTLKFFEKKIKECKERLLAFSNGYSSLAEITGTIIQKDDSALACSDILHGIDINPACALDDLYDRIITKYIKDISTTPKDDRYAWKSVYKQYFDKYEITSRLKPHTVKTNNDRIEFDKAWKNGVWNCYQTLSFDLSSVDAIKSKVYKWSGILSELEHAKEELHLYFLTISPSKNNQLQTFINKTLSTRTHPKVKVTLVDEKEADQFVASVKQEIDEHSM